MSWKPFEGPIRVGDQFVWAPYGSPAFENTRAKAWCRCEVVDITKNSDGEVWIKTAKCNSSWETLDEKEDCWNEEDNFRDHVGELRRFESKYGNSPVTTDNPRPYEEQKPCVT